MNIVPAFTDFIECEPRQSVRRLAARALAKCGDLARAGSGTIHLVRRRRGARVLELAAARPRSAGGAVPVDPSSVVGHVALTGESLFLDDVRRIDPARPFAADPGFGAKAGGRVRSLLCFALSNDQREVVGVVQLAGTEDGAPVPFDPAMRDSLAGIGRVLGRALERAEAMERISESNRKLRERNRILKRQRERIAELQKETERALHLSVELLARAAEFYDEETGNHILRVNEYSYALARFSGMPQAFCDEIRYSAALHDVGKMSVDIGVLRKRDRLEPHELEEIQRHPLYGDRILSRSDRLRMAADIARAHHEKWDGSGYPNGLRGEEIPLAARIVAIADIYDALRSERPYKPGLSHARAVDIILNGDDRIDPRGHFDPGLLEVFGRHHEAFAAIWDRLVDRPGAKVADAVGA